MQRVILPDFDTATLVEAVGSAGYAKGAEYVRNRAVVHSEWDSTDSAIRGLVRGSANHFYATAAYFSLTGGLPPEFETGECSCPVGIDCKHVVALVLAAAGTPASPPGRRESPRPVTWERSLDSLLAPGPGNAGRPDATSLAIELTLAGEAGHVARRGAAAGPPQLKLLARLVRPGQNGGWVSGGLGWGKLDTLRVSGSYPDVQVRLLQEMYALYRTCSGHSAYYGYRYGDDRSIEVSAFESRQLWPLLDEADSAGLR